MEFIPKTNETLDDAEREETGEENIAPTPAGADILSELGNDNEVVVHERTLIVNDKPRTFYIQELSYRQLNRVNEKKWRKAPGGALEFDVANADNNVTALTLHLGVVQPHGEPSDRDKANWAPLFSLEQLLGVPELRSGKKVHRVAKPGLLDKPSEAARLFIFALQGLVWEVNPTLDPMLLAAAQAA